MLPLWRMFETKSMHITIVEIISVCIIWLYHAAARTASAHTASAHTASAHTASARTASAHTASAHTASARTRLLNA